MRRSAWLPILAVATSCAGQSAAAQIGASRTALATVVDPRGRSIVDLDADDIVVREAGSPRDVLSVRVADYPIALVLDNGPAGAADFPGIRDAAARFVGRVGHRPIAVALADRPQLAVTFEDDRTMVAQALEKAAAGKSDGLFDAIVLAARHIHDNGSAFSAIVVVSGTPKGNVPEELLTPILESGATLHVIATAATGVGGTPSRPLQTLRALADQTHGQFTTIYSAASYQVALDRLADRLAPELMIDYVVPVGSSAGNDVQLGVRIPGARVVGRGVR